MQYLLFSAWFISLSKMSSMFTHIANGRISFFFKVEQYFLVSVCIKPIFLKTLFFLSIHLWRDTYMVSTPWLLWVLCSGRTDTSLRQWFCWPSVSSFTTFISCVCVCVIVLTRTYSTLFNRSSDVVILVLFLTLKEIL